MTTTTPVPPPASPGAATGDVEAAAAARPLRRDAARNREALLAAAAEVFGERGLDASLDDVARRAGLGVGTAYRHFANKHELARALMEHQVEEMVARLDAALEQPDALTALVDFLGAVLDAQSCDVGLRQVLQGVGGGWDLDEVLERLTRGVEQLARRAQDAGQLREDVAPTDFGVVLVMLGSLGDVVGTDHPDLWRRYFAMCLDGLCTRRGAAGSLAAVPALDDAAFRTAMAVHKSRKC